MKVTRSTFDPDTEHFIGSAHGPEGDGVQIDFVGPSARLFRRVWTPETQVVIEATDTQITFKRIDNPPAPVDPAPVAATEGDFRQHLKEKK